MTSGLSITPSSLSPRTSGFALAAAVTALLNTALAWAKDAYPALNSAMKSLTGHHWTTHGLIDLAVFILLGTLFTRMRIASRIDDRRLVGVLIGSVSFGSLGLALWYVFY